MEKKNSLFLTIVAVAVLLAAVVGATFAYFGSFTTTVTNRAAVNVTTAEAKCRNPRGPSRKAKYSLVTDSEQVP